MKTKIKLLLLRFINLIVLLFLLGVSCNNEDLTSLENIDSLSTKFNSNYWQNLDKVQALMSDIPVNKNSTATIRYAISKLENEPISSVWHLDRTDLIYTYLGLSIKGSGGGGGFMDGIDILNNIQELDIYDISAVDNNKLYIVAGGIGAPSVLKENLSDLIQSIKSSVYKLAKIEGKELGGILSVESGSANATIAMLLSKELKLPLINADGAGRSVPKLSNLSYAYEAYKIAPTVLASVTNPITVEVLTPKDADDAEKLIRATISKPDFGQIGGLALWAQTGSQLKESSIIENTYREAYELGLYTALAMYEDINLLDLYFKKRKQFISSHQGTLIDFDEKSHKGFDITTLTVKLDDGNTVVIKALNENLLLTSTNGSIVTAPHIISYMVEVEKNKFIPYNNGDAIIMKSLVGKKIHIITALSNKHLYDYENTFLKILKDVFGYYGSVLPPVHS